MKKIAIGSDHAGFRLKEVLIPSIRELGFDVLDLGCHSAESVDYPDFAQQVCEAVRSGEAVRGVLICGTGIGMSMAANKIEGIRCALVHDLFSAQATREHNNANVLAMGERVIGPGVAAEIVKLFLQTEFSVEDKHQRRVDKVMQLEQTKE